MGAIASAAGIAVSLAIGGVLSLRSSGAVGAGSGSGAHGLGRTVTIPPAPSRRRRRDRAPPVYASRAPNTSAAFSPPKPNEVLSTRR